MGGGVVGLVKGREAFGCGGFERGAGGFLGDYGCGFYEMGKGWDVEGLVM